MGSGKLQKEDTGQDGSYFIRICIYLYMYAYIYICIYKTDTAVMITSPMKPMNPINLINPSNGFWRACCLLGNERCYFVSARCLL